MAEGHFAKSPLAGIVPTLLTTVTILEVAAGALQCDWVRIYNSFARFNRCVPTARSLRVAICALLWAANG
jgi:hypothetical protein